MQDAKSEQAPASAGTDTARVKTQTSPWGTPVLAFLAGVCLGGAAGYFLSPAPPLEETRFMNFDPESTPQGVLVSGFSSAETNESGDTFRWCDSANVRLKVRTRGDGARTLRMRYWPFEYADGPKQAVSILVNEQLVGTRDMKSGPHVAAMRVPAHFWRKGDNEVRFKFKYAEAPAVRMAPSQDKRTLSAAFDWLEILPR
jgi:hypothetical protein